MKLWQLNTLFGLIVVILGILLGNYIHNYEVEKCNNPYMDVDYTVSQCYSPLYKPINNLIEQVILSFIICLVLLTMPYLISLDKILDL